MRKFKQTSQMWGAAVTALTLSMTAAQAKFVCGNVSGTWTKTDSPVIVTCDIIVPPGETLTIEPGVTVIIGQGLKVTVDGNLIANGTATERIAIRGANPSLYWDNIQINYSGGAESTFINCSLSDATNALHFRVWGSGTMSPQVSSCTFSNCLDTCILGNVSGGYHGLATLSGRIANCRFNSSSNGVYLLVSAHDYGGRGATHTVVANNLFYSLSGSATWFAVGTVDTSNPEAYNNLFVQCATAIQKTGSSTSFNDVIAYNCFYNNTSNFVGYPPGLYGTICCVNARGTNCDLAYNIFENPQFCETTNYTLLATSPCIDAGNPAGAFLDNCLTNACQKGSLGTTVNDIGIWGGPGACAPGGTIFELSAMVYPAVTIHPSTPGQYRLEYRSNVDYGPWIQVTNVNLLSTPWTYVDFDSPGIDQRFYRAVLLP